MHAVLQGVTRQITTMWFNSKHHTSSFYLGNKVKQIDTLLLKMKPPSQIRRSPRSIASTLKFWKAGEFRAWLLFYSLPIIQKFIPHEYVHHWSLLVYSINALLGDEIPTDQLPEVAEALGTFCNLVPELYGLQACTANMHSLLHLVDSVEQWGPLWTYSLFGFENINGHIRKMFHGTHQILDQLVFSIKAEQSLFFQVRNMRQTGDVGINSFLSSYIQHHNISASFEGR